METPQEEGEEGGRIKVDEKAIEIKKDERHAKTRENVNSKTKEKKKEEKKVEEKMIQITTVNEEDDEEIKKKVNIKQIIKKLKSKTQSKYFWINLLGLLGMFGLLQVCVYSLEHP